jgi:hypothetical protein
MMRFGLLSRSSPVEISQEQFEALQNSITFLSQMTNVEEKFDITLENMLELEQEFVSRAAQNMMFRLPPVPLVEIQTIMNRRFVNLLTACRLYLDHTDHHMSALFGSTSEERRTIQEFRSKLYDQHFGYRVMESLRNYVQHRGLAVHSIAMGESSAQHDQSQYSMSAYLQPPILRIDGGIKSAVLRELEAKGEFVDVLLLAREYVECLGRIHVQIRRLA